MRRRPQRCLSGPEDDRCRCRSSRSDATDKVGVNSTPTCSSNGKKGWSEAVDRGHRKMIDPLADQELNFSAISYSV